MVPSRLDPQNPKTRELEAMGVVASSYEPIEVKFDQFRAAHSGKYRLRFNAYSFWAGPKAPRNGGRPQPYGYLERSYPRASERLLRNAATTVAEIGYLRSHT